MSAEVRLLKRLAAEARKLAYECAEGTAPPLIEGHFTCGGLHCALGEALARIDPDGDPWNAWGVIDGFTPSDYRASLPAGRAPITRQLIENNNRASNKDRHMAVIFPLLTFADDLEAGPIAWFRANRR